MPNDQRPKPHPNPLNLTPEAWRRAVEETEREERERDDRIRARIEEGKRAGLLDQDGNPIPRTP